MPSASRAGFLGGAADEGLSLVTNVFLVLPALPLLIIVLGFLPHSGQLPTAFVLSILGWAWGARVIRAQTLTLRGRDFVAAARETGEPTWRLVVFEVLPNEISLIAANFVGTFLYAILTSVALAFIGVANLNSWSLGVMLYWAQNATAINIGAWWWYLPPGLAVALLGMSLVLLNFGLDELGNPRLRRSTRSRRRARRATRLAPDRPDARAAAGGRAVSGTPADATAARRAAAQRAEPLLEVRDLSIVYDERRDGRRPRRPRRSGAARPSASRARAAAASRRWRSASAACCAPPR